MTSLSNLDSKINNIRVVYILFALCVLSFVKVSRTNEHVTEEKLLHSIVFVTKRPGGYDILLYALAKQTNKNFELICVDELALHRKQQVEELANELGLPLVAVTTSKPKTHGHTRFGIANAFNTGFILSSGNIITVLQDYIYLPADFVDKTLAFHRDHPDALLSYPEYRFEAPVGLVDRNRLNDMSSITVFRDHVTEGPLFEGWKTTNEGSMPLPLWSNMNKGERIMFDWLECACCSVPWDVLVELNGVDEALDTGDDCHEVNLKVRSQMLDKHVWNEGACPVQLIDHHRWARSETWTRFTENTNIFRWDFMKQQMEFGEYPLRAPNNFDLTLHRTDLLPARGGGGESEDDAVRVRILAPAAGHRAADPLLRIRFALDGCGPPPGGCVVCVSLGGAPSSACMPPSPVERGGGSVRRGRTAAAAAAGGEGEVWLAAHWRGAAVIHAVAYDSEFRAVAEAQVGVVIEVPAPVGELGRLAGAAAVASGWVKGEVSGVPSGLMADAVQEVFRPEHDLPRESMLFIYNKDPAHVDTWRDGLWAAVRIMARHYNVQYLNVNDVVVAEQPEISYFIRPGTFKFILGWGAFGSPTDYFMTQIHNKHGDRHPKALCIGGNAVPPHRNVTTVYNLLFFETEWYRETISFHPLIRQAFGINTNIYHPLPRDADHDYIYDVLMVGHFLPWKRHYMLLEKPGRKLAVGEIYQEYEISSEIVESLKAAGVEVTNMLPPRDLADLYRRSRLVYFPMAVIGGGERAVLEARACGATVEVAEDNPKLQSLRDLNPIPDHHRYAEQLLAGVQDMLIAVGASNVTTRPPMPRNETVVEQRIKELIRHTCRPGEYCPYVVRHN